MEKLLQGRKKAAAVEAKLKAGKGAEVRSEAKAAEKAAAAKYTAELAEAAKVQINSKRK